VGLRFQHIGYFFFGAALLILVGLFIWVLRWKHATARKIGDKRLVDELIKTYSPHLFNLKFILLALAFAAGVLGLANLRKPAGKNVIARSGIDVVMALDVSRSMYATDLEPNRLERAKQLINKLMDEMPNDRIGLVIFAGRAYLQMPLTTDHEAAKIFVSAASPDDIPAQGTVLSAALEMSSRAFNAKEGRFKSVVLISDGEDHDADAISKAAELAELGVMVNTVGVGSQQGSYIVDPGTGQYKLDASGTRVITKLNEEELKEIAAKTNGQYIHLEGSDETAAVILKHLSQIEGKAFGDTSLMNYTTYYGWFAAGVLLLIIAEFFIPERKWKIA
jgi:Ca-activated chloride channel homolog